VNTYPDLIPASKDFLEPFWPGGVRLDFVDAPSLVTVTLPHPHPPSLPPSLHKSFTLCLSPPPPFLPLSHFRARSFALSFSLSPSLACWQKHMRALSRSCSPAFFCARAHARALSLFHSPSPAWARNGRQSVCVCVTMSACMCQ